MFNEDLNLGPEDYSNNLEEVEAGSLWGDPFEPGAAALEEADQVDAEATIAEFSALSNKQTRGDQY